MSHFGQLLDDENVLKRVAKLGYHTPTPIQEAAIPHILEGDNVMGAAPTGTGKTAAFMLPVLQLLGQHPRRRSEEHTSELQSPD